MSWRGYLRVILPVGNTDFFEEMSQRWRVVGNTASDLTARDLKLRPPPSKTLLLYFIGIDPCGEKTSNSL